MHVLYYVTRLRSPLLYQFVVLCDLKPLQVSALSLWGPPYTGGPGQTAPVAPRPCGGTARLFWSSIDLEHSEVGPYVQVMQNVGRTSCIAFYTRLCCSTCMHQDWQTGRYYSCTFFTSDTFQSCYSAACSLHTNY